MSYSKKWDVAVAQYESRDGINNEIDIFAIHYDPELKRPTITYSTNINSFTYSISPFFIDSFALH